ncbi:MAG: acireductone synthase [Pirellula sp.]|jgi:enolase-phosphatase E1|nr:acireductone synthase [Pirellula sp.]
MHRHARCVLLDIEGTVADVRFVYDVMFPFVRREVASYLERHWDDPALQPTLKGLAEEAGLTDANDPWGQARNGRKSAIDTAVGAVHRLMDQDSKTTGLKSLQGRIWESGFQSGSLTSELFPDVLPALRKWQDSGIALRIYSSGSVLAQKLFFGHTIQGDITSLFDDYYDTTIGNKREASSYQRIAVDCHLKPAEILFLSDVAAELDAAAEAGMQVLACVRPNNAPLPETYTGPSITSFDQLHVSLPTQ